MKRILIGAALLAVSTMAQVPKPGTEAPQIVLTYDHTQNGELVVVPQGRVALGITPFQPTNPAPLEPGSYMICRPFSQPIEVTLKDGTEKTISEIAFRCGSDIYLFNTLSITPEK